MNVTDFKSGCSCPPTPTVSKTGVHTPWWKFKTKFNEAKQWNFHYNPFWTDTMWPFNEYKHMELISFAFFYFSKQKTTATTNVFKY